MTANASAFGDFDASIDVTVGPAPPAPSLDREALFRLDLAGLVRPAVVSVKGREELSSPYRFLVRAQTPSGLDLLSMPLLGQAATLVMRHPGGSTRVVKGVVSHLGRDGLLYGRRGTDRHGYRIRIVPRMSLLRWRRTSRVFQDLTVPEIVCLVLREAGVAVSVKLSRLYPRRLYCLQYQETDLDFVHRLLAEAGIFYWFDHPSPLQDELGGGLADAAADVVGAIGGIVGGAIEGAVRATEAALGLVETVVLCDSQSFYPALPSGPLDGLVPSPPSLDLAANVSAGAGGISASASIGLEASSRHLTLRADHEMVADDDGDVDAFVLDRAVRPSGVLCRDFDFQRPLLDLRSEAHLDDSSGPSSLILSASTRISSVPPSSGVGAVLQGQVGVGMSGDGPMQPLELQVYDHRAEFVEAEASRARAVDEMEQHRRAALRAEGRSACRTLLPGTRFWLDASSPDLVGEYTVVKIEHEGTAPEHCKEKGRVYQNRFWCVPSHVPYRPKRPEPVLRQVLESATVVGPAGEEIHTDEYGRIKVQFHWDLTGRNNETSSCWVRVVQAWAGAGYGAQFVPRIGMEVMVSFLNGDQDCPVVLGCVPNATHPVPFQLPSDKTRSGWRTSTSPGGWGSTSFRSRTERGRSRCTSTRSGTSTRWSSATTRWPCGATRCSE